MPDNYTKSNYANHSSYVPKNSYLQYQVRKHWYKPLLFLAIGSMISQKDFSMDMSFNSKRNKQSWVSLSDNTYDKPSSEVRAVNTSMLSGGKKAKQVKSSSSTSSKPSNRDQNLANTYSNLGFDEKEKKIEDPKRAAKRKKQLQYVNRYAEIAQSEMEKYGIPASIKLAQGLLESNVGESPLAVRNNNHFGIKCFSRTCRRGHCSNFSDDSHKDFFRKYKNAWESFRAHSQLLQGKRYRHLKQLGTTNYEGWATGLKSAGYATDKRYAPKIIRLIEDLQLYKYDY